MNDNKSNEELRETLIEDKMLENKTNVKSSNKNNKDDLDAYFKEISESIFSSGNDDFRKCFNNSYLAGENTLYQKNMSETKNFDDEWIKTIESYFPSIDRITRNPRSFIKYNEEIVDVERAKKVNSSSVRHLASHTQYIRSVDENNEVIPSKILTHYSDSDYDVYENRFLATLINRLFLFVRNRLLVIRENVESFQKDHLILNSKFNIFNDNVEMNIDLLIKKDLDNKTINEKNYLLLERAEKLSVLIDGLKGSDFMQKMKKSKPIHPPIMKTNVILKNPDFRNAYTLWLFMDKYSTLGYDVDVKEKNLELDSKFRKYIDELMLINYTTLVGNINSREKKYSTIEYDEYSRKRKKTAKKNLKDLVQNPDELLMEDNTLNEYFLEKYKRIFNKSVEELEDNGEVRHDEALKRALRQTTEIVNGLYESIFKFEEEKDVFNKLNTVDDEIKEYASKKEMLKKAKIIREIKNIDLNKMIRLERKLSKDLKKLNSKMIKKITQEKTENAKPTKIAKLEVEMNRLKKESKDFEARILELENVDKLNNTEITNIKNTRDTALNEVKVEVSKFEKSLKKDMEKKIQDIRNEYKVIKQKYAKSKKAMDIASTKRMKLMDKKLEEENLKIKNALIKKKEELEKKLQEKIERERLKELKKQEEIELRDRLKAEAKEQQARERLALKKLKAYEEQQKLQNEIDELKKKLNPKKG